MKYLSLFIKLVVLVNLISGYFGDLFDLDELKDKTDLEERNTLMSIVLIHCTNRISVPDAFLVI